MMTTSSPTAASVRAELQQPPYKPPAPGQDPGRKQQERPCSQQASWRLKPLHLQGVSPCSFLPGVVSWPCSSSGTLPTGTRCWLKAPRHLSAPAARHGLGKARGQNTEIGTVRAAAAQQGGSQRANICLATLLSSTKSLKKSKS